MASAISVCLVMTFAADATADVSEDEIAEITVTERRVANTRPAGTYAAVATALRFDPQTELQSRGLPEGQADVTVRGGLFENTGFKAGAVTIMDPQTGHYAAELPIDPEMLTAPDVLTGIDNTASGFNSNIATVSYSLRQIVDGGALLVGAGSDNLQYQSLRFAKAGTIRDSGDWGVALSLARSEGDGSVQNGDHEFERYNLQLQRSTAGQQSDFVLSYQDKFYGWPGAYTGFASLAETDHTKTTLLLANHRSELDSGYWQIGGFYRRLEDDYDFDRTTQEAGAPGSFDHETRVYGIGFQGLVERSWLDWHLAGQVAADELVSSTDLTEGDFDSRNYGSISIVPSLRLAPTSEIELEARFGASVDWSNRDNTAVSPVLGWTVRKTTPAASSYIDLQYASSSQLPGYTVLNSRPAGLFGGNPTLGRVKAKQLSITFGKGATQWSRSVAVFYRKDDDLVDWTYESGAPFARQANSVDLDVYGLEVFFSREWDKLDLVAGYTFLDKDADYGSAVVDASFYALNFARHRATLALRYRFTERLELHVDNEYRVQEKNPLRSSSDKAYLLSATLAWEPPAGRGFGVALAADNLSDDDYEQFPGTPAVGRQISLSARYAW